MKTIMQDVSAFHVACDVPILAFPQAPPADRINLRISLIAEEVGRELLPALVESLESPSAENLERIADGMADAIYVIVGAALEYGIPLDRVWDAVQAANMAKVDPASGRVRRRDDGKILKPDGWQAPDIAACLRLPLAT